jgi:hypothetical protein
LIHPGCGRHNEDVINSIGRNFAKSDLKMTEILTAPSPIKGFRVTVFAFACLLGGLATWILVPEFLRPAPVEFPTDAQSAATIYAHRGDATKAARIGLVRGDLWIQAAFAYGDFLWNQDKPSSGTSAVPYERAQELTERAISYAPHDSRLWLLLAAIDSRFDWLNDRASAALRMSYYTGSNAIGLVPARLLLSMQTRALQDSDFQDLVRHDIRIGTLHKSELMPAMIAAYDNAPLSGQQFIEKTLGEIDPSMLASIHSKDQLR